MMVKFLIIDVPSSYNVIFGRPILNSLHAIVSTFHIKLKFPVQGKVGEFKGDQYQSQKCWVELVRVANKVYLKRLERIKERDPELKKYKFMGGK